MVRGSRASNKNRKRDGMGRKIGCDKTDIQSINHFYPNCELTYNARDFIGILLTNSIKTFREEMKQYDCLIKLYIKEDEDFIQYFDNMIDMGRVIWYFDYILKPILKGNFKLDKTELKKCKSIYLFGKMTKIKIKADFDELNN
jgi:hypothetical protein